MTEKERQKIFHRSIHSPNNYYSRDWARLGWAGHVPSQSPKWVTRTQAPEPSCAVFLDTVMRSCNVSKTAET